jgi:chromosome segregation ATPase
VIPEEEDAQRRHPPREGEPDTFAERRARRAWLGDAALLRRAEAAETSVRTLESHLADLRRRQEESERLRERTAAQLAERELELRRVKQREYAEQQLRVEAEEAAVRARRSRRAELDHWQRRAEEAQTAAQYAEEQRDTLAVSLAAVSESCERLRAGVTTLQSVAAELRTTFEHEHRGFRKRIRELEGELERARAQPPTEQRSAADEARRREEMAGALAAAVTRLRARAVPAPSELPAAPELHVASELPIPSELPALSELPASSERPASSELPPPTASASPKEITTVFVVPRLFVGAGRLRPFARRVAARLAEWAGPGNDSSRS